MIGETIKETTLRELVAIQSIRSISAVGQHGGFMVAIHSGMAQCFLASARGGVRLFPNLTTLATFLRRLGITRFEVETVNYQPGRVRAARPDRAEALKLTRTQRRQATFFEGES